MLMITDPLNYCCRQSIDRFDREVAKAALTSYKYHRGEACKGHFAPPPPQRVNHDQMVSLQPVSALYYQTWHLILWDFGKYRNDLICRSRRETKRVLQAQQTGILDQCHRGNTNSALSSQDLQKLLLKCLTVFDDHYQYNNQQLPRGPMFNLLTNSLHSCRIHIH